MDGDGRVGVLQSRVVWRRRWEELFDRVKGLKTGESIISGVGWWVFGPWEVLV